jgi:division protein CdvB (Snf7/Vps24/ESCRT-III family)
MTMSKWVKSESVVTSTTDDSSSVAAPASPPKPGGPLRPRLEAVQKRIENQIGRLENLQSTMNARDDETFRKLMTSIKESNAQYSTVLSAELSKARQMSRIVSIAKLALEKIHGRLATVSDFGDLVIVLSPAMAVVKNVRSSLVPYLPELEEELGIISELLSGILVDAGQVGGYTINFETANEEAVRIVEDASNIVEQKMKEELPGIPDLPMVPKVA